MAIVKGGEGGWPFVPSCAACGVGLNNPGDLDKESTCWEIVLHGEVRLVVGEVASPGGSQG